METSEIIKFIFYGFSLLIAGIGISTGNALLKPKFFKSLYKASLFSFSLGIIFELQNYFHEDRGFTLVMMSIPLIYLTEFELLRRIFVKKYYTNPIITSSTSKIGEKQIIPDLFAETNDRKIILGDFVFSICQGLFPSFTIVLLLLMTKQ